MRFARKMTAQACVALVVLGAAYAALAERPAGPAPRRVDPAPAQAPAGGWRPAPRVKRAGTIAGARGDVQSLADKSPALHAAGWKRTRTSR